MTRCLIALCMLWFAGCATPVDPIQESQKIDIIKNAHVGYRLGLTLREATVTYVVEAGPDPVNDPAGFFLQAHAQGPALFLPFEPEEFQPYPKAGDVVTMTVLEILDEELWMSAALWVPVEGSEQEAITPLNPTRLFTDEERASLTAYLKKEDSEMLGYVSGILNGRIAIVDYAILGTGPIDHLVSEMTNDQGLSHNVDPYSDRLVTIKGIVRSDFDPHGKGFRSALLGVKEQAAMSAIRLRMPDNVIERMDIRKGCTVDVGPTPLRRYKGTPVFSIYDKSEVRVSGCPAKSRVADLRTEAAPTKTGQIVVSELMVRANSVTGRQGQWIELHNPFNGDTLNLKGCYLVPENPRQQHLISSDIELAPGGFVVLSNSELPGGFTPDANYADAFDLRGESGRVRVALRCGRAVITKVDLPLREEIGRSYALGPQSDDGKRKWCMGATAYNRSKKKDDMGTPGQKNDCP